MRIPDNVRARVEKKLGGIKQNDEPKQCVPDRKNRIPRTGYGFCGTANTVAQLIQPDPRAAMIAKQTTVITLRTR